MTEIERAARTFKAFCDPNRLTILGLLRGGELCACKLLEELQISQPTLSHHMRILAEAGIVHARRDGKWTHYRLSPAGIAQAQRYLAALTAPDAPAGCCGKS